MKRLWVVEEQVLEDEPWTVALINGLPAAHTRRVETLDRVRVRKFNWPERKYRVACYERVERKASRRKAVKP